MAEKILNTRFQLPYDTYTNWSTKNPKLKKGEMVQVEVPAPKDAIVQAPSVLIKVGDGTHNFNDLAWASGLAADIYDWAKAANKPSYKTSELTNDSGFISQVELDNKQNKISANGILKGDGSGTISAADTTEVELVELTKANVGLGNVDNTSDLNKPISTATKTALEAQKVKEWIYTIPSLGWTASEGVFKYTYSNTNLRASVSPIITCTSNTSEYNYITNAEATANTGITFTAKTKPNNNIVLQIIDLG